jgi:nicotinamide-nucleotide amidase
MSKAEQVVNKLMELGYHISCAESCTGGLVAASIVSVANASAVFDASFVTYANDAKIKYLDVPEELIEKYGVVSEQVAACMALGAAKGNNAQIGLSTSGIAGPTGGTKEKPVGTVCFGISINEKVTSYTCHFGDIGRNQVREKSVEFLFDKLLELL